MRYVLVIMVASFYNGAALDTHSIDFLNERNCIDARAAVYKMSNEISRMSITAICVEKR